MDIDAGTSKFDLTLSLAERGDKLVGFFEYSTDLFHPSTIERMVVHFRTLLEGIIADPDQPISMLPLLTEAERHQLLVEWNDTVSRLSQELLYPRTVRSPGGANAGSYCGAVRREAVDLSRAK